MLSLVLLFFTAADELVSADVLVAAVVDVTVVFYAAATSVGC